MQTDRMVLRTIYLTEELDAQLRQRAFEEKKSKGALMREYVAAGLQTVGRESEDELHTEMIKIEHHIRADAADARRNQWMMVVSRLAKEVARGPDADLTELFAWCGVRPATTQDNGAAPRMTSQSTSH